MLIAEEAWVWSGSHTHYRSHDFQAATIVEECFLHYAIRYFRVEPTYFRQPRYGAALMTPILHT
jgi:hypothetical protein